MVTEDRSRGQLILIGAITLAFIILGIVVVFNGVLYTETLSSGPSSQSATAAEATAFEVERGVGCLLVFLAEDKNAGGDDVIDEIETFGAAYQNTSATSSAVVKVVAPDDEASDVVDGDGDIESVNVTVAYDSNDISYTQTLTIERSEYTRDECGGQNA